MNSFVRKTAVEAWEEGTALAEFARSQNEEIQNVFQVAFLGIAARPDVIKIFLGHQSLKLTMFYIWHFTGPSFPNKAVSNIVANITIYLYSEKYILN